jgi:hypothetical protein
MKFALSMAAIGCLFLAVTAKVHASAEDQIDNGLIVAKAWVAQIDAGKYDESYSFACDAMRDKVTQKEWETVLKALRIPWGPVVSRKQISHVFKPNGLEKLEGECLVITYDTSFKNLPAAIEVIVLKWEDGKWRGGGYNAGPKPNDDDSAPASTESQTETHTEPHVKPVPQAQ